jgi:hypothetical protein
MTDASRENRNLTPQALNDNIKNNQKKTTRTQGFLFSAEFPLSGTRRSADYCKSGEGRSPLSCAHLRSAAAVFWVTYVKAKRKIAEVNSVQK